MKVILVWWWTTQIQYHIDKEKILFVEKMHLKQTISPNSINVSPSFSSSLFLCYSPSVSLSLLLSLSLYIYLYLYLPIYLLLLISPFLPLSAYCLSFSLTLSLSPSLYLFLFCTTSLFSSITHPSTCIDGCGVTKGPLGGICLCQNSKTSKELAW